MVSQQRIEYSLEGRVFHGILFKPRQVHGAILLAHAWKGLDSVHIDQAKKFAALGYITLAADLYGLGIVVKSDEEAAELMQPLYLDRLELRKRMKVAYKALQEASQVDKKKIGGVGFCFGGLAITELLREGACLHGVSTHGLMGYSLGTLHATPAALNYHENSSMLILHGHKDPLVSEAQITEMKTELNVSGIDWQMEIFGQAAHAFTNPLASNYNNGLYYHEPSAQRAWKSTCAFFEEKLKGIKS